MLKNSKSHKAVVWSTPTDLRHVSQAGTDNHLNRKSNSQSEWTSIVIHLFSSWLTGKTTMEQQFQYDKLDLATKCFLWQTHFLC